jgi:aquaporin related protein
MFLTAQLVFTIFMLATEKHEGTFIAPVGIGLSLFVAELMGVYYTGGSVNPARSFGPCVVTHTFASYHWIYWVGPILGAILASTFYMFIKACEFSLSTSLARTVLITITVEYETVNLDINDPKAALGEKFKQQPVVRNSVDTAGHQRTASGGSGDTFDKAAVLESGGGPAHH